MILLGALIGALGFRLRGSALFEQWTGRGATTARIVCWAIPIAILSLVNVPILYAPLIGLAIFLGAIPGWYGSLDLGRDDGHATKDYVIMTVRGLAWTAPAAYVMSMFSIESAVALVIAGLMCPLAYTAGWYIPSRVNHARQGPEVGELIFGSLVGMAVMV